MYGQIPTNHLHSPQLGNEQVVFITPTPGLAPSPNMYATGPMAPSTMQFTPGHANITGMSTPSFGYSPVTGLQVPMWAPQVPQPPPLMGNMLSYPAQPVSYPAQPVSYPAQPVSYPAQPVSYPPQPVSYHANYFPPVQQHTSGMLINSQVQSYSIVPQQYLPVTNRAYIMGQQSTVPYVMHQEYLPLASNYSGIAHAIGSGQTFQPQYIPNETHSRQTLYQMSTVQQAQCVPHYSKPRYHMAIQGQRRGTSFNPETFYDQPEGTLSLISVEEENHTPSISTTSPGDFHAEQDEQLVELVEDSPRPSEMEESTEVPILESIQTTVQLQLSDDVDILHSPSETTLVPSPLSSDGLQTVCNSPSGPAPSDSEEEVYIICADDDQIPTKDISSVTASPLPVCPDHVCCPDTALWVKPEQPYIDDKTEVSVHDYPNELAPSKQELPSSRGNSKHATEDQLENTSHVKCSSPSLDCQSITVEAFDDPVKECSQTNHPNHEQQPIRSLIDTPIYNTGHSKVLSQLSQPTCIRIREQSNCASSDGMTERPLTSHFRLLFKPIPVSAEKDDLPS